MFCDVLGSIGELKIQVEIERGKTEEKVELNKKFKCGRPGAPWEGMHRQE